MKIYPQVRMSIKGHYTTESKTETSRMEHSYNTTDVTTENAITESAKLVDEMTSLPFSTLQEQTTPEIGNIGLNLATVLVSSAATLCLFAVITSAICCYISKRFRRRQCGITRRGRTKKMKRNAKRLSHHDLVMLETNTYNALVENIISNPLKNPSSSNTHENQPRKKLTHNGGSPVTEPVYLVLIPDPPTRTSSVESAENDTSNSSPGVEIKSNISSSVTIPVEGADDRILYENVSLNRADGSVHDNVIHRKIPSKKKCKQNIGKHRNKTASAVSEVKGHDGQTGTLKPDSSVIKGVARSQVNENSQDIDNSELKVRRTDAATASMYDRDDSIHRHVYENVSLEAEPTKRETVSKTENNVSTMKETGSKIGETGSKIGDTVSKIGETGSKIGETGSKIGETGSTTESKTGETRSKIEKTRSKTQDKKTIDGTDNNGYEDIELA